MRSPQPLIDFALYVAVPVVLGLKSNSYKRLVRNIGVLCLLVLVPQVLLDLYCGSVIPGVAYLIVSIPALAVATVSFLIRVFIQRRSTKNASQNT